MLSLAGATRDQMAAMLLDMNCKIVGEEPDEDPEKPPIQIFERLRRQRPAGGGRRDRRPQEQNDRPRGRKNAQGQRHKGGRPNSWVPRVWAPAGAGCEEPRTRSAIAIRRPCTAEAEIVKGHRRRRLAAGSTNGCGTRASSRPAPTRRAPFRAGGSVWMAR